MKFDFLFLAPCAKEEEGVRGWTHPITPPTLGQPF